MALTPEQETEIMVRIRNAESSSRIIKEMNILRSDFKAFRKANKKELVQISRTRTEKLFQLNRRKKRLEDRIIMIRERLTEMEKQIAAIEAK